MQHGIPTRQFFLKEKVVEMTIQQRAVHIKEDIVDVGPVREGLRVECRVLSHSSSIPKSWKRRRGWLCLRQLLMIKYRNNPAALTYSQTYKYTYPIENKRNQPERHQHEE